MNEQGIDYEADRILMDGKAARYVWPEPEPAPPEPFTPPPLPRQTPLSRRVGLRRIIIDVVTHKPGRSKSAVLHIVRTAGIRCTRREALAVIELFILQGRIHVERSGNQSLLHPWPQP